MCGFVAVITPDPAFPERTLVRMRDRLAHRGPDGAGALIERVGAGTVALGHRRLAILDLTPEAGQPMVSADQGAVIVFNGEIYNHQALRADLAAAGVCFRTRSDTEVLLAAWQRWGEDCLSRLNGMFAFVIWDRRRRVLFAARDRFGEKPFYYAGLPGGGLVMASEMKALFAHPDLAAEPEPAVIGRYLDGENLEIGPDSFFRGVHRLPPAHAAVIGLDGQIQRLWRYWLPDYEEASDFRPDEAVAEFRALLEDSVRLRLQCDVPVGTSLSGGLDSSTLVCLVARILGTGGLGQQRSFSARFDQDATLSEGAYIDQVVAHTGVRAFACTPVAERFIADSERLHWHQEEPPYSLSAYLQWCVMRLARDHGATVLIDGQGADELLGGYAFWYRWYQCDLLERRQYRLALRETRAFSARLLAESQRYQEPGRRFEPNIALDVRGLLAQRRRGFHPDRALDGPGVPAARPGNTLRRHMASAMQFAVLPALLRYADRNAMAFGREVRLPFLDYRLVEWVQRLPDRAFIQEGWQKWLLRRAGEGLLPPAVQWRVDKMGFTAPQDRWLRGPLAEWSRSRLFEGAITGHPRYDRAQLEQAWDEHCAGRADRSRLLWLWISLSEWFGLITRGCWRNGLPLEGETMS